MNTDANTAPYVSTINNTHWSAAKNWVSWWTRPSHLRMLNSSFSDMDKLQWDKCPATTNAVERKNKDSKGPHPIDLKQALLRVYRIDKAFCLQYIAAEEGVRIRCRDASHEAQAANKKKQRHNKSIPQDKEAVHGPPDKQSHFQDKLISTKKRKRPLRTTEDKDFLSSKKAKSSSTSPRTDLLLKSCKMLYDDGVWYEGIICGFEFDQCEQVWKYKVSFSDGETALTKLDDPDLKLE